ncbi:MAG: hypothetical protein DRP56_02765 [Planctomycetota bacterium]|nr:MAG: hypothetical protein DRP56_02765 [Planctomycetota bacterium]
MATKSEKMNLFLVVVAICAGCSVVSAKEAKLARVTDITKTIGTTWHSSLYLYPLAEYHDEMEAAGIKWYRGFLDWDRVEMKEKDYYVFPGYTLKDGTYIEDKARYRYESLLKHGITPYVMLCYGNDLYGKYSEGGYDPNKPETDYLSPEGFANYCGEVVERYKDIIHHWEIGNEPRNFFFGRYYGGDMRTGDKWIPHFVEWTNQAAKKIREIQPDAYILSAGDDHLNDIPNYFPQIAENVDAMAIHPYVAVQGGDPTPEGRHEEIERMVDLANANGVKDVWITEFGWQTESEAPGYEFNLNMGGRKVTGLGQAKYLLRAMFYYPLSCEIKVVGQFCWKEAAPGFSMSPTTQSAHTNMHTLLGGASKSVSLENLKGTKITTDFTDKIKLDLEKKLVDYLLVKDKNTFYYGKLSHFC